MNIWALFAAIVLVSIWWIYSAKPRETQFPVAIERQAKILAGFAAGILGFQLASQVVIPLGGVIISSVLTIAVWLLALYDKYSSSFWKWCVKFCMSIDAGYSALALTFGALANKIPLNHQVYVWIKLGFYACCYVFLGISIIRFIERLMNKNTEREWSED